tara:strand:+ start:900 stop:1106 length:207 start_codon:yes stop_codon:yes gene_type:complete
MISFNPYTVKSPRTLENLLKAILKALNGIIILGIFTIVNMPNPIVRLTIINMNVINPIKLDLIIFILV